jgi:phosphoribosylformylglycinamidine synthase subunit PurQ / glutaminase
MKPKALVLQAHGSNRDFDVIEALTFAGATAIGISLNELRMNKTLLSDFQLLVIPGGFSYADALGAGKLLALDLTSYFVDEISAFVQSGKPVIGICNGFQALVKSGILPGDDVIVGRVPSPTKQHLHSLAPPEGARTGVRAVQVSPVKQNVSENEETASGYPSTALRSIQDERPRNDRSVTLTFNAEGHFECRWVTLRPVSQTCIWTKDLDELIECPVAHGEGNFQTSELFPLSTFVENDQIALTYIYPDGSPANGEYPISPNGSILDIAGICNPQGNVLGLMPHPENHIHPFQHPQWTRGIRHRSGLALFKNGVKYACQI